MVCLQLLEERFSVAAESNTSSFGIRMAQPADLEAINEIYNIQVRESSSVYNYADISMASRVKWFEHINDKGHEVIVAEVGQQIAGFAYYTDFRKKEGYRFTVESTVHLHPDFHGIGLGTALMKDLIERMRFKKLRTVIAVIGSDNEVSIHLHEKLGFEKAGYFKNVGYKFDQWLDAVLCNWIWQKHKIENTRETYFGLQLCRGLLPR